VVGVYSLFGLGLSTVGPCFIWSLPVVVIGQLFVALVFSELSVSMPLAGALYQWTRRLVGEKYGWFVGWIYGIALLVTVASINLSVAPYIYELVGFRSVTPTPLINVGIACAMLLIHTGMYQI
jgi:amino acid transporter